MTESVPKNKRNIFRSIRTTLALALFVLSLVLLLVSSFFEIYFNYLTQRMVVANEQQVIGTNAADAVKNFINEKNIALDQAADINSLADSADRRSLVLNKLIGRNEAFRQVYLVDATGKELLQVSRFASGESVVPDRFLSEMLDTTQKGRTYLSQVYIDKVTGEPLVLIAVPARNAVRQPSGALVAELDLKFMWDLIGNIHVGSKGVAYVVNKQGGLIAFGDTSRVLSHENLSQLPEVNEYIQNPENDDGDHAAMGTGINNTLVSASFVPVGVLDWAVIVEQPVTEAYASVIQMILYALLITVVGSVLSVGIGFYLSNRFTRGLIALSDVAKKISLGQLDTRIEALTENEHNEIGNLAGAINEMAERLSQYTIGLETEVKKRTDDLNTKLTEVEKLNKLMIGRELAMIELKEKIKKLEEQTSRSNGSQ